MDPRSKARYEGLFNRCVEAQERGAVAKPAWVKRDERDELDALVVRGIWERSRLEKGVLRAVWTSCDTERRGALRRDEFVKGLWLIDEELRKRRKLV